MFVTLLCQMTLVFYPVPRPPEGPDKGPGYLGVTLENADGGGVLITEVREKSPAQMSGLKVNDVILKYDGQAINETDRFVRTIVRTRPGNIVPLEIRRDEKKMTLKVKIGVRPDDFPFPLPEPDEQPKIDIVPPPDKK